MNLTIGHLYSWPMNTYGDDGNIITLKKRCQWRGIEVKIKAVGFNKFKPGECDLYFFGGGQDQSQELVAKDLKSHHKQLLADAQRGVPFLSICGGYQLLGEYYAPFEGPKLEGVGIFPAYTNASHDRMIGNIVIEVDRLESIGDSKTKNNTKTYNPKPTTLVGFENHSGKTYLKPDATPLGKVIKGFGNNGEDKTEGCIYKNAIGCYMHGSLLPKNPQLADWLIKKALEVKYSKAIELDPINDELESQAHNSIIQRFY